MKRTANLLLSLHILYILYDCANRLVRPTPQGIAKWTAGCGLLYSEYHDFTGKKTTPSRPFCNS